jgi:hypothetical protein
MDVLGNLKKVLSFAFRAGAWTITFKGDTVTPPTKDITINIPDGDASQLLVTDSSTNTFTNKTYDADGTGNVLTNVENANIKAAAAIDADKIHDGSVSNTEFGYISTVTSNVQDQLDTDATNLANHLADAVDAHDASAISFDNVASGLTATEVQAAIDEVEGRVDTAETNITLKADKAIDLTAGDGLSGGGDLSANRTFTVNVDDVGIETATDTLQLKDLGVTTAKLADDSVTLDKINADVAGDGLGQNVSGALEVNVDDSTIETNTDALRVKALGITNVHINDLDASKIDAGTLADARLSSNVDLLDTAQTLTGEKTHEKVVLASGTAINANGSSTLAEPDKTIIALTGVPTVTDIATITATSTTTGKYIQLQNDTVSTFVVRETGNIKTGGGGDLDLLAEATIILRYDGTDWRVVGGSGGGGGGLAVELYDHTTLPATLVKDIRYLVDVSGGNATSLMPILDADNDGSTIEVWPINTGVTGNTITLTRSSTDNFNDADLGVDTVYVIDVGRAAFVFNNTDSVFEVGDSYWAAATDAGQTKYARKFLSSDKKSDGVMADLTYSNLTIGKQYKYTCKFFMKVNDGAADVTVQADVTHDSVIIDSLEFFVRGGTLSESSHISSSDVFTATATTLTFVAAGASANSYIGGGTVETHTLLEELPQHAITTDWD